MSLDVYLSAVRRTCVYEANVTHNMTKMAREAGIYKHLWRPEEVGVKTANNLIIPLKDAIQQMEEDPQRFIAHNPANGWGSYAMFLPWLKALLTACEENPDAEIRVSR